MKGARDRENGRQERRVRPQAPQVQGNQDINEEEPVE